MTTHGWIALKQTVENYPEFQPQLLETLTQRLESHGFEFQYCLLRGVLFYQCESDIALIIDHLICHREHPYSYTEYTKEQNSLMHQYAQVYRISVDDERELEEQWRLLQRYLERDFSEDEIRSGGNRTLSEIDPTLPESFFEQAFIDCYGREALDRVSRELPMIDIKGQTRWVDYYLHRQDGGDIAIEKNGETYHHPIITGKAQYQRQLVKQNSLVAYGAKVFRWSMEGMRFVDNFHEELKRFFGPAEYFQLAQKVSVSRNFALLTHQVNQIDALKQARGSGNNAFLVVLPTGTGKTEVLIADFAEQYKAGLAKKCLVMVSSKQLKLDHIQKFTLRLCDHAIQGLSVGERVDCDIVVQTYSMLSRHFHALPSHLFDYLAVDEAHHATAPTVKKVIQHFCPKTLIGLTATDKRLDARKLEDIFGSYDTDLSLVDAIKEGLLSPIKAFRLHSNLDFSDIRFNGKDYLSTDLQKHVIVPSRDQLVVDTLLKYFVDTELNRKQGIIFCVSVKHAESLAKLMKLHKISAVAVSGKDNKSTAYIQDYQDGKIQFLTTCSLLNEGWDSPHTSVIVMARPTMSKVLYTQQLGRGTRKCAGKEALYVIDVVDNYGASSGVNKMPWSIHALLGVPEYRPWESVLDTDKPALTSEEVILAGLYEQERLLEKINIFTFESEYPDHISDEQLARELFVSTGTVNSWVKKGRITPAVSIPLGRRVLNYYAADQVEQIRAVLDLKKHDETTIYEDFWEFVREGNYTFSYKIVMMLSFLEVMDHNGECHLDTLVEKYTGFYRDRLEQGLPVDRPKCPYQDKDFLANSTLIKTSLLQNPFEKFERKRFMYHCKDLNHIAFSTVLWSKIGHGEEVKVLKEHYRVELERYYEQI
ncbi:DEAD/DEAH box helicase [Nitrincola iocasae]|uniref:DEAD/DEAH box helicase n=1 Tax=Nitrincola iocasae TaxID=2614693 RepID=A0A5J6LBW4_9GAMM|nr:DEAD/DEAH box helicase [Nitrincola iocasae]QEW05896.1 DEAD/DEAH box helicase [Nitrincola iocasae]